MADNSFSQQMSRSEMKRQHKQIEEIVRELVDVSESQLRDLPIESGCREAIIDCRSVKGGALKRQLKYAAKLLKEEPLDDILALLRKIKGSKLEDAKLQHEAERLRDLIVNEALQSFAEHCRFDLNWPLDWQSEAITEVVRLFPDIDENDLRRSVHQYARNRNKVHYRELFRMLRAAAEKRRIA